jgi:glyoxylase-like metal-dependent hydrolase (beta-lactamase superfamily II)
VATVSRLLRRLLARPGIAVAAAVLLLGCATGPTPAAVQASPPRAVELADGVYLLAGSGGLADGHNLGRIGNSGFVVGEHGVLAVDTGTSYAHGQAILAAIRQVTAKPVLLAIVTHVRPEFVFGGAAFRERGIPVALQSKSARLMAARCETCLKQLRLSVGDAPMEGTVMYTPDREFDATHTLATIGRPVRVLYLGHSSGPGDVAVYDERSGVLFAGGLLDQGRIPDIQDGEIGGWRQALAALAQLRPRTVVPGHGPAADGTLIATVDRYLVQLTSRARALVEDGTSLLEVADALALPEFSRWDQYDTIHRRNASIAYLRFERESFFEQAGREEARP